MNKIIFLIWMCALCTPGFAQYYYYYFNEKMPLSLNTNYVYITTYNMNIKEKLNSIVGNNFTITGWTIDNTPMIVNAVNTEKGKLQSMFRAEIKMENNVSEKEYLALLLQLRKVPEIAYVSPCFLYKGKKATVSHRFYVKLNSPDDYRQLQLMAEQSKVKIIGQNKFMSFWYTLACDKNSAGNAIELANQFYESGKFATVAPEFFNGLKFSDCPTSTSFSSCPPADDLFADQWGLQNTGQSGGTSGIDINACSAWSITTGSASVITAIIDGGVQLDHPDLCTNIPNNGFDATNGTSPSVIHTSSGDDPNHATELAGIVAGVQNSAVGISGVAPTSSIISVSMDANGITDSIVAAAINFAWDGGGASVLNCSFTFNPPSSTITDAINNALTSGRGGLGSVVVFSAGNNDEDVEYPANLSVPWCYRRRTYIRWWH